jgi:hypothetical protein
MTFVPFFSSIVLSKSKVGQDFRFIRQALVKLKLSSTIHLDEGYQEREKTLRRRQLLCEGCADAA